MLLPGATSSLRNCTRREGVSQPRPERLEWSRRRTDEISYYFQRHHFIPGGRRPGLAATAAPRDAASAAARSRSNRRPGLHEAARAISRKGRPRKLLGHLVRTLPRRISPTE